MSDQGGKSRPAGPQGRPPAAPRGSRDGADAPEHHFQRGRDFERREQAQARAAIPDESAEAFAHGVWLGIEILEQERANGGNVASAIERLRKLKVF